ASPEEFRLDYGQHGEAIAVKWKRDLTPNSNRDLVMTAELVKTQFRVTRAMSLKPGETVVYVTETVENLVPYGRPMQWGQHVTFGPPFVVLGKTFADASVSNAVKGSGPAAALVEWPQSRNPDGSSDDFRRFTGVTSLWVMDQSKPKVYFTLYNEDYKV